jgi:hypothetical protein
MRESISRSISRRNESPRTVKRCSSFSPSRNVLIRCVESRSRAPFVSARFARVAKRRRQWLASAEAIMKRGAGSGPCVSPPVQPGGFFFAFAGRELLTLPLRPTPFGDGRCSRREKSRCPSPLEISFKVKWDPTHNQSSGFVVAPVSKTSTRGFL